jgi:hypothetical protein
VRHGRGIQYVEHTEGDGAKVFKAVANSGLRSQRSWTRLIDRVRRKPGSRSKIRRHPPLLAPSTAPSKRFSTVFSVPESGTVRTKIL